MHSNIAVYHPSPMLTLCIYCTLLFYLPGENVALPYFLIYRTRQRRGSDRQAEHHRTPAEADSSSIPKPHRLQASDLFTIFSCIYKCVCIFLIVFLYLFIYYLIYFVIYFFDLKRSKLIPFMVLLLDKLYFSSDLDFSTNTTPWCHGFPVDLKLLEVKRIHFTLLKNICNFTSLSFLCLFIFQHVLNYENIYWGEKGLQALSF